MDFVLELVLGLKCLIFPVIPLLILFYILRKLYWKQVEERMYLEFSNTPKNTVVIHAFSKINFPSNIPTTQPWVQKIELFCKLANIPYIVETVHSFGPNSKSPWISINGIHKSDSQIIIEYLEKKFDIPAGILNGEYNEKDLAVARSIRVMLEERFFWALPLWRVVWKEGKSLWYRDFSNTALMHPILLFIFRLKYSKIMRKQTWEHGIGRHSKEDALEMMCGDLKNVSIILGNRKYILGDKICREDCAIFGMLAQVVYGMPESPYEKLVLAELPNLKEYVDRIKQEYFPEWN